MNNKPIFYTDEIIKKALLDFEKLIINGPADGDEFFAKYGCGNTSKPNTPYERFEAYQILLSELQDFDPIKYQQIHKGTPFYFLAWTAFDLKNYEKAVFYMDAAIAEDQRKDPINWLGNPAGQFLTLDLEGNQSAPGITKYLRDKISTEFFRFNGISGVPPISVESFVDRFVKVIVKKKENRSIITAIYSFILEFEDRYRELLLRSIGGGSIEPALTYLFKGGLIFESLLKYLYPQKDNTSDCKTLGDIFNTSPFKVDFIKKVGTSANSLGQIIKKINNKSDLPTAFNTTSQLRNTTGHNLVWNDVFNNPDNFKTLYEQQLNAIFYLLQRKFIK